MEILEQTSWSSSVCRNLRCFSSQSNKTQSLGRPLCGFRGWGFCFFGTDDFVRKAKYICHPFIFHPWIFTPHMDPPQPSDLILLLPGPTQSQYFQIHRPNPPPSVHIRIPNLFISFILKNVW